MDITDIKAENVKQILNHLRFSSGLTKRELADMTGLSFSTVSNLCNELKDSQVLNEEKSSGYAVGRTPNRLMFRREQYGSLCVDLHQEHILNFTVLDFSNRRLYQDCQNISSLTRVEQVVSLIGEQYRMLRTAFPAFSSSAWGFRSPPSTTPPPAMWSTPPSACLTTSRCGICSSSRSRFPATWTMRPTCASCQ